MLFHRILNFHQFFNLLQEPWINFGLFVNLINSHAHTEGISHIPNPIWTWLTDLGNDVFEVGRFLI